MAWVSISVVLWKNEYRAFSSSKINTTMHNQIWYGSTGMKLRFSFSGYSCMKGKGALWYLLWHQLPFFRSPDLKGRNKGRALDAQQLVQQLSQLYGWFNKKKNYRIIASYMFPGPLQLQHLSTYAPYFIPYRFCNREFLFWFCSIFTSDYIHMRTIPRNAQSYTIYLELTKMGEERRTKVQVWQ